MEPALVLTAAFVLGALVAVWLLPLRKRWNDDGSADEARRQAVLREIERKPMPADTPDGGKDP